SERLGAAAGNADNSRGACLPGELLERRRRDFRRLDHQGVHQRIRCHAPTASFVSIRISKRIVAGSQFMLTSLCQVAQPAALRRALWIAPRALLGASAAAYYSKSISPTRRSTTCPCAWATPPPILYRNP